MENQTNLPALSEMQIMPSGEALQALTRAKVDSAITTAKAFPRSLQKFRDNAIFMVTMDAEIAESCFYKLPQDGKMVEGESVRFAEILQSCYNNIETTVTPISNDGRFITVMGSCIDYENNITVNLPVSRSIRKKDGTVYSDAAQKTATMAATAVAFRNAILKVIPKAFIKVIAEAAKAKIAGTQAELPTRRVKYFRFFADNYKVSEERVLKALARPSIDLVTLEDLPTLAAFMTSLKDGEVTIEDIFPIDKPTAQDEKQGKATDALKGTADKVAAQVKGKAGKGKVETGMQNVEGSIETPHKAEPITKEPQIRYLVMEPLTVSDIEGESLMVLETEVFESTPTKDLFKLTDREVYVMLHEFVNGKVKLQE
jgi:hypothetical protein